MVIPSYVITILALVLWWHYCAKPAIEQYQDWKARRPIKPPNRLRRWLNWLYAHGPSIRWERLRNRRWD